MRNNAIIQNMPHQYAKLPRDLKGKCVDYINKYLAEDFFESSAGKLFTKKHKNGNGIIIEKEGETDKDWITSMDNFLLFGTTLKGKKVLNVILEKAKKLTQEEKEILMEWEKEAFESVFEIIDIKENSVKLFDVAAEVEYDVYSNMEESLIKIFPQSLKGGFMYTNIVPIKNFWFLSGIQHFFSPEMEQNIFENFVQKLPPKDLYRNNPKKLERALNLQKEIYDFFIKHYGSDEVIVSGKMLSQKQWEFYNDWNAHLGGKNPMPQEKNLPKEIEKTDSVGIIMHPVKGEYLLIDYARFVEVFAEPDKRRKGWQKIVLGYLEDESMPRFVFERIKERYPDGFRKVIKDCIERYSFSNTINTLSAMGPKKDFDPLEDFDVLMEKYKPVQDDEYPSVYPLNERFKRYYYRNKVGRNDSCPCGSGKKYKKCHGK